MWKFKKYNIIKYIIYCLIIKNMTNLHKWIEPKLSREKINIWLALQLWNNIKWDLRSAIDLLVDRWIVKVTQVLEDNNSGEKKMIYLIDLYKIIT